MQQALVNRTTGKLVLHSTRTHHRNIVEGNIRADFGVAADNITADGLVLGACCAVNIRHGNIIDRQAGRELVAKGQVLLAITLCDLNGIVDIGDRHVEVCDVIDTAGSSATLQVAGKCGW